VGVPSSSGFRPEAGTGTRANGWFKKLPIATLTRTTPAQAAAGRSRAGLMGESTTQASEDARGLSLQRCAVSAPDSLASRCCDPSSARPSLPHKLARFDGQVSPSLSESHRVSPILSDSLRVSPILSESLRVEHG
jgi:hypothetical protein